MLIESKRQHPDEPGILCYETIVPDDMKMNPECPCQVRCCPKHGFCKYCKQHHDELIRAMAAQGLSGNGCACHWYPEELTYRESAFTCGAGCEESGL